MESVTAEPRFVMVCDDDASVRGLVRATLEREGYVVVEAVSANEACRQTTGAALHAVVREAQRACSVRLFGSGRRIGRIHPRLGSIGLTDCGRACTGLGRALRAVAT